MRKLEDIRTRNITKNNREQSKNTNRISGERERERGGEERKTIDRVKTDEQIK